MRSRFAAIIRSRGLLPVLDMKCTLFLFTLALRRRKSCETKKDWKLNDNLFSVLAFRSINMGDGLFRFIVILVKKYMELLTQC